MTVTIVASEVINGTPCTRKIRSSKNLRAIIEHNRATGTKPSATLVKQADGGALVGLEWPNGDVCNAQFADASIAWKWFEKRSSSRAWHQ